MIDGRVDVDAIIDMSGMPREEVVAILAELIERMAVVMR
jgi:DNA-nicking Smr family endonuclease